MPAIRKKKYISEAFRQELLSQIFSGELKTGSRLASNRELSERYGLSYVTVNKVIRDLSNDGFLKIKHGSGTVVEPIVSNRHPSNNPMGISIYAPVINKKMWYNFLSCEPELKNVLHSKFDYEYRSLLSSDILSSLSDVLYTADCLISTMAEKRFLRPLNDIIEKYHIDLNRYPSGVLDKMTCEGKIYALPICFSTTSLFYNKTLFDKAGVEYPTDEWTWDDLVTIGKKMTVKDHRGRIKHFGFTPFMQMSCLENFILQGIPEGLDVYESLVSAKYLGGINFFLDLIRKHEVSPPLQNSTDFVFDLFLHSQSAMVVGKSSFINKQLKEAPFEWGVSTLPAGLRSCSACSVQGFGMSNETQDIAGVVNVLKKLTGESMQKIIHEDFGHLPAYEDLARQAPYSIAFIKQIPHSFNIDYNYAKNKNKMNSLIYKMVIGFITSEDFMAEMTVLLNGEV